MEELGKRQGGGEVWNLDEHRYPKPDVTIIIPSLIHDPHSSMTPESIGLLFLPHSNGAAGMGRTLMTSEVIPRGDNSPLTIMLTWQSLSVMKAVQDRGHDDDTKECGGQDGSIPTYLLRCLL